jgi:adenylate kinase family enzyme
MTLSSSELRISVVGTSGSGKTTLARQIVQQFQIPHVELDALHWEPHWTMAEPAVFQARVEQALRGDRWVVDGNYSVVRPIVWSRANLVVWLDYEFPVVMRQVIWRTLKRVFRQEELWSSNRETFKQSFCSRDSIILWSLQTYRDRRKKYPVLFQQAEYQHLQVVQLRSSQAAQAWLSQLAQLPPVLN